MPSATLAFASGEAPGLEELGGASPLVVNALPDATGTIRTRPGVAAWADFPAVIPDASPVIGMYPWGSSYVVYVTEDRKLWALGSAGSVLALSDSTTATQLPGSGRPTFTEVRPIKDASDATASVIVAGGGAPMRWTGSGLAALLGGTPPPATHVAYIALRVVANRIGSGQIDYTDPNTATTWAGEFEAEARPDPIAAIADNANELFAFGTRTTQCYVPDASTDFALARTMSVGCGGPYSVIPMDAAFGWLDDRRRLIISNNRNLETISSPAIDRTLAGITTVSDCWGFRAKIGAYDLLVWMFPTDQRGFCYEANSKTWSDWRSYAGGGWAAPYIRSYAYWQERNLHLVGLADGSIGVLSLDAATEGTQPIRIEAVTGFEDHNLGVQKQNTWLSVTVRRGAGAIADPSDPQFQLSWRDGGGAFGQPIRRSLGKLGDSSVNVDFQSLGVYRNRQWKIAMSDPYPLVISKVYESFNPLEV